MTLNDERRRTEDEASSFVFRPSSLVDTHCHLDLPQFDPDREAVVERAGASGVGTIINPAIDLASCARVLALADRYPGVYAAVGVHPNECAGFSADHLAALRDLVRHPKVVAVGEIGLDYYWERVPPEEQKRVLRAQLALAVEVSLPVILHSRNPAGGPASCAADLLWEIEQWWPEIRKARGEGAIVGVWHAFSGTLADASRAYALGLMVALGGPVTFRNARQLQALVPELRGDRLLLETDAPYLAPHPHRGQRNEPGHVALVAGAIARLRGCAAEAVASQTTASALRCFGRMAA